MNILDTFKLNGKKALVTGGNTGLGRGMAVALAQAGADIAVVARREARDTRFDVESLGRNFLGIQADLGAPGSVAKNMKLLPTKCSGSSAASTYW
jgi:NAD(P)-dependent dehydrogenase (short-subunit alcohol dehydrogenase family)